MGVDNFMTVKEKDYVAECFRRNMKYFKSDIEYHVLFASEEKSKITFERREENDEKRALNLVFGKEGRKSIKKPRIAVGLSRDGLGPSICTQASIEDLLDKLTVIRRCELTKEEEELAMSDILSILKSGFNKFVSYNKIWRFLHGFLKVCQPEDRVVVMTHLQRCFHLITDVPTFYEFVDSTFDYFPEISTNGLEKGFARTFLSFPAGIILATSMLLKNSGLQNMFFESIIDTHPSVYTKDKYSWQFLAILVTFLDPARHKRVLGKTQERIVEIVERGDKKELHDAMDFFEVIGVKTDDII